MKKKMRVSTSETSRSNDSVREKSAPTNPEKTEKPAVQKAQMIIAQFVNKGNEKTPVASTSGKEVTMKLTCDLTIKEYKYGHSKRSGCRNTLFVMCERQRSTCLDKNNLERNMV